MHNPTNSLQRFAAGAPEALAECIDTHGDLVWGMILEYGVDGVDAERVAEEVFAQLWQRAGDCPDGSAAELVFVATCVRRQLLGVPVHAPVRREVGAVFDADVALVRRALLAMTEEQQTVLRECLLEGCKPADVGARLILPVGVVREYLRSGVLAIRDQLAGSTAWLNAPGALRPDPSSAACYRVRSASATG